MDRLNYDWLKKNEYKGYILEKAPEKVLQFGEGNFLRAFVNYWFDISNEKAGWNGKCAVVQPIETGLTDTINSQEGLYTLYFRGRENGNSVNKKRIISSISRCLNPYKKEDYEEIVKVAISDELEFIVSNTTEAGIVYDPSCQEGDCPPTSFPAKLTQLLYKRYLAGRGGLVILSCELIDNNGKELLSCVKKYVQQWDLEKNFNKWLDECVFCSTLVDKIVPGMIRDKEELSRIEAENGYKDSLIDVGEVFGVWNIEGPEWLEEKLPFKKAGINCPIVRDVTPYKNRKVRILNGAHTGFVLAAYLAGFNIVRECMEDSVVKTFMNKMLNEEIVPTLALDKAELDLFVAAVQDRFNNPFINHELLSISLNSTSKWKARNMPSLVEYFRKTGTLPVCLVTSFAAYIAFYSTSVQRMAEEGLVCERKKGDEYIVSDDQWILNFYYEHRNDSCEELVESVIMNEKMWGAELREIEGLQGEVSNILRFIREKGAYKAMKQAIEKENDFR